MKSFPIAIWLALLAQATTCAQSPRYAEHQELLYWLADDASRQPVRTPAEWESRRAHILENVQQVMGPLPSRADEPALDLQVLSDERAGSVRRRKVAYHADSMDRRVRAWLLSPSRETAERLPAVLCLHQTIAIGKDEPAGLGKNPHLDYALELAERGYVALAPDYPSFGEYAYDFSDERYASGSMKAICDNRRAVDLLSSLAEVDPQRLGAIGHSLGGHNAIFTALFEPRLKAVVSSCGFTRFHKYYQGDLAGWTSARYMPRIASFYHNDPNEVPFDFTELIAALAPRPFLAVAPVNDGNFDVDGVRDVMTAAANVYRLFQADNRLQAIHPPCSHDFPDDARQTAYRFFDAHLSASEEPQQTPP